MHCCCFIHLIWRHLNRLQPFLNLDFHWSLNCAPFYNRQLCTSIRHSIVYLSLYLTIFRSKQLKYLRLTKAFITQNQSRLTLFRTDGVESSYVKRLYIPV